MTKCATILQAAILCIHFWECIESIIAAWQKNKVLLTNVFCVLAQLQSGTNMSQHNDLVKMSHVHNKSFVKQLGKKVLYVNNDPLSLLSMLFATLKRLRERERNSEWRDENYLVLGIIVLCNFCSWLYFFFVAWLIFYHVLRVFHNLAAVVGNGVAEKSLLSSKRYTAQEALAVGLVDKVVPKDEVLAATKSQMEELTAFSGGICSLNLNALSTFKIPVCAFTVGSHGCSDRIRPASIRIWLTVNKYSNWPMLVWNCCSVCCSLFLSSYHVVVLSRRFRKWNVVV